MFSGIVISPTVHFAFFIGSKIDSCDVAHSRMEYLSMIRMCKSLKLI
jgi:hypothetical protein